MVSDNIAILFDFCFFRFSRYFLSISFTIPSPRAFKIVPLSFFLFFPVPSGDFSCITAASYAKLYLSCLPNASSADHLNSPSQSQESSNYPVKINSMPFTIYS